MKRLLALAGTFASVLVLGAVAAPAQASYVPSYSSYTPSYSSYVPSYSTYTPSYSTRSYTPSYGYRRPGMYRVRSYIRRNGTYVSSYLRRYPVRSYYR
jgi:hypothetical protein